MLFLKKKITNLNKEMDYNDKNSQRDMRRKFNCATSTLQITLIVYSDVRPRRKQKSPKYSEKLKVNAQTQCKGEHLSRLPERALDASFL